MRMKRCGQAVRLIINAPAASSRRVPDAKMVALLARAHDWFGRLTSGHHEQVSTIAAEDGFSPSYVTRVIYLAFLAPDVVRRIASGEHAPALGTDRLMKMLPLPLGQTSERYSSSTNKTAVQRRALRRRHTLPRCRATVVYERRAAPHGPSWSRSRKRVESPDLLVH